MLRKPAATPGAACSMGKQGTPSCRSNRTHVAPAAQSRQLLRSPLLPSLTCPPRPQTTPSGLRAGVPQPRPLEREARPAAPGRRRDPLGDHLGLLRLLVRLQVVARVPARGRGGPGDSGLPRAPPVHRAQQREAAREGEEGGDGGDQGVRGGGVPVRPARAGPAGARRGRAPPLFPPLSALLLAPHARFFTPTDAWSSEESPCSSLHGEERACGLF